MNDLETHLQSYEGDSSGKNRVELWRHIGRLDYCKFRDDD